MAMKGVHIVTTLAVLCVISILVYMVYFEHTEHKTKLQEIFLRHAAKINIAEGKVDEFKRRLLQYIKIVNRTHFCENSTDIPEGNRKLPWLYIITPTYTRVMQKVELTRLKNTLQNVKNFRWIIVEDGDKKTKLVEDFLQHTKFCYTHLSAASLRVKDLTKKQQYMAEHRGVQQRNAGLRWMRENLKPGVNMGAVYFADDDNAYEPRLFDEIRWTRKVSVFPVGFAGATRWEGPLVENGKVTGWRTGFPRMFPIDMAGFAVNIKYILTDSDAEFKVETEPGYLETDFLEHLVTVKELEPMAKNCTEVLVWHVKSKLPRMGNEKKMKHLPNPIKEV